MTSSKISSYQTKHDFDTPALSYVGGVKFFKIENQTIRRTKKQENSMQTLNINVN